MCWCFVGERNHTLRCSRPVWMMESLSELCVVWCMNGRPVPGLGVRSQLLLPLHGVGLDAGADANVYLYLCDCS